MHATLGLSVARRASLLTSPSRHDSCHALSLTVRNAAPARRYGSHPQARFEAVRTGLAAAAPSKRREHQRGALLVVAAQKQSFSSFDDMIACSEVPLLVDFYASWCGPCVMLSPILGKIGERLKGRLQVVKIDTDKYPQIASRFRIQALPTVVLFRNGKPVDRIEGLLNEQQLLERVSRQLQPEQPPSSAGAGA